MFLLSSNLEYNTMFITRFYNTLVMLTQQYSFAFFFLFSIDTPDLEENVSEYYNTSLFDMIRKNGKCFFLTLIFFSFNSLFFL